MSFHTDYDSWLRMADPAFCPVCQNEAMPSGMVEVRELGHSWLCAEPVDCLRGACHLIARRHYIELYEMPEADLLGFMQDVQRCAQAIQAVTGAVKMNYEIHGNSAPHLHLHLYPRYIDDPFPGQPIDYRQKVSQYAPGQFERFVEALRQRLA